MSTNSSPSMISSGGSALFSSQCFQELHTITAFPRDMEEANRKCMLMPYLALLPCVVLMVTLPYYARLAFQVYSRRVFPRLKVVSVLPGWPLVFSLKMAVIFVAAADILFYLFYKAVYKEEWDRSQSIPVCLLLSLILDGICLGLHRCRNHAASLAQLVYWALLLVVAVYTLANSHYFDEHLMAQTAYNGIRNITESQDHVSHGRNLTENEKIHYAHSSHNSVPLDSHTLIDLCVCAIFLASVVSGFCLQLFSDNNSLGDLDDAGPEDKASAASVLTISWVNGLVYKGFKRPLEKHEIPVLRRDLDPYNVMRLFDKKNPRHRVTPNRSERKEENNDKGEHESFLSPQTAPKKAPPSILMQLLRTYGLRMLIVALLKTLQDFLRFVPPQVLKRLIRFISNRPDSSEEVSLDGYWLAGTLFVSIMVQQLVQQQYFIRVNQMGLRLKQAVVTVIYRKSMSLSAAARQSYSVGQVVNLAATDAAPFHESLMQIYMAWSMPVQLTLSIYFLFLELGMAMFAGVAVLIFLIPFNVVFGRLGRAFHAKQLKAKDHRVKAIYELLSSMLTIRLNTWEDNFRARISVHRTQEVRHLRNNVLVKAMVNFIFGSAPVMVTIASFGTFVAISEEPLTPEKVFVCVALFNLLRFPLHVMPNIIAESLRLAVSIRRINAFLAAEDRDDEAVGSVTKDEDNAIELSSCSIGWNRLEKPVLSGVSVCVPRGSLVGVVGRVGVGKTTLLAAVLGQAEIVGGSVNVSRRGKNTKMGNAGEAHVAYVSQHAWLQTGTIKANILFGQAEDSARLSAVYSACCLEPDLKQWPNGEDSLIGENGVTLSGGQKQRVALARAIYRNASIYLLDDPLSALDAKTAAHVFTSAIGRDGMLGDTTRVLVTHNVAVLAQLDYVLVLRDGRMETFGTPEQVLPGLDLATVDVGEEQHEEEDKEEDKEDEEEKEDGDLEEKREDDEPVLLSEEEEEAAPPAATTSSEAAKRIKDESVLTGRVKLSAYGMYLRAVGVASAVGVMCAFVANQALGAGTNIWLAKWADHTRNTITEGINGTEALDNDYYIGVLGGIGAAQALSSLARNLCFFVVCTHGSRVIHRALFDAVLHANMRFYDTTNSGALINRFATDMYAVDTTLPLTMAAFLQNVLEVITVLTVISLASPWFVTASVPLCTAYIALLRFYQPTSRQLQRMEAKTKSPINLHISESVTGSSIIAAMDDEARFIVKLLDLQKELTTVQYAFIACKRWLALRSELIGNLVVLSVSYLALSDLGVSAGWAGLTVTLAMSITDAFHLTMFTGSRLEELAVSLERINDVRKHAPAEDPWHRPETDPKERFWVRGGSVSFSSVRLRYAQELAPVLRGLSFSVAPGERVGVCGRTGAGKSSVVAALFNLVGDKCIDGDIRLDDVATRGLGLHSVRRQLTVVSQEPVMFSGTLRHNLDPAGEFSDDEMWAVLNKSPVKELVVPQLENGLDFVVQEGGNNFSAGQRQLLCICRALLRVRRGQEQGADGGGGGGRIVVLDEATSSMDAKTDDSVQRWLLSEVSSHGATVLAIAHRLQTLHDHFDRVLVVDAGVVIEADDPKALVLNKDSVFRAMLIAQQKHSQVN